VEKLWIGRIINKIHKNTNEQQLFMRKENVNVRREGKPSASRAEELYCNETSQSGQSIHSPDHQLRCMPKIIGVKE
jgi:hypothetical protein